MVQMNGPKFEILLELLSSIVFVASKGVGWVMSWAGMIDDALMGLFWKPWGFKTYKLSIFTFFKWAFNPCWKTSAHVSSFKCRILLHPVQQRLLHLWTTRTSLSIYSHLAYPIEMRLSCIWSILRRKISIYGRNSNLHRKICTGLKLLFKLLVPYHLSKSKYWLHLLMADCTG